MRILKRFYKFLDIIKNTNTSCMLQKETKESNFIMIIYTKPADYFGCYIYENLKAKDNFIMTIYTKSPDHIQFDCYENLKAKDNIPYEKELIVVQTEYIKREAKRSFYSFFNPITLEKIYPDTCEKVIVEENLCKFIKLNEEQNFFINQGINICNISDDFYTNICFNYNSWNGKDIPLKIRIDNIFTNKSICSDGSRFRGIDIMTRKVKCEDIFEELDVDNLDLGLGENIFLQTNEENTEFVIIKCIKDIFDKKRFSNCIGGFIIIALFFLELICYIKYIIDGLKYIIKYLDTLTQSFIDYISKNKPTVNTHLNNPPINKKKLISKLI